MKFSALVSVVPENMEDEAIECAKKAGATGITLLSGRGIGNNAKRTFFGLTYEGAQSVLLMVVEKSISLKILKAMQALLQKDEHDSKGIVFTVGIEHLAGIDMSQVERFEEKIMGETTGKE
ncbi:P-II family nitrogen regulator [Salinivibrio socompensis]|uniref:P-II family nitrogen regulator n=1 Tax=Salinivibrio socompensis TaxID=1510206 RepID=UPI0004701F8F|nr:hypothetical protein [Salinivibrio socompensis]